MKPVRKGPRGLAASEAHERLPDYLDGTLPADETAIVEAHVRACAQCRHAVTSLPGRLRMLRSLRGGPGDDLLEGILARIQSESETDPNTTGSPEQLVAGILARLDAEGAVVETLATRPASPSASFVASISSARQWVRGALAYCLTPNYLRRSLPVVLVAGILLTVLYELGDLVSGRADAGTYVMCACNFLVPFVVVNLGMLMARASPRGRYRA